MSSMGTTFDFAFWTHATDGIFDITCLIPFSSYL